VPLRTAKGLIGTLNLGSKDPNAFNPDKVNVLEHVAVQVAVALENARTYRQLQELREKVSSQKTKAQEEKSPSAFQGIVGQSRALGQVLQQAKTVAGSDATVLILGETGTGKELIARAIHQHSPRRNAAFIKVNCAAIPTGLLESELFGHEKGAFTGAISQKIGRLELADKGTMLLDEVGEIPLELQPKLLRVLQDQEFERLGGTRTIRVNVRLVAATNRDLARSVSEHQFRSDLYYRLHVFPIRMPALRERTEDIPQLVQYFVDKIARRMNRVIEVIPDRVMLALLNWPWPGNVRELENFIERSIILSDTEVLAAPLAEISGDCHLSAYKSDTLESVERDQIIRILRESSGVIGGMNGAASRLGMKRTTLQSRMQKLGIARTDYMS
ncbi:MAG: sigma 54-interacting transcriptional regulator, partial [Acidobacteriales bacterium]|nr:sigma 54-interacting transcriptional regulator [Terriglobales bacterium]